MADKDLKVIGKAKELMVYTYTITSNSNNFPKKYRHSLVDRTQLKSMNIYEKLYEANRMDIRTEKQWRLRSQSTAIVFCDELMAYIELAREIGIIDERRMEVWSGKVKDVKHMTLAWLKIDKSRAI